MKILLLVLFPLTILFPQTKLDSMLTGMKDKPDTTKIRLLCDLCWKNRYNDPAFSISAGEKALSLAKEISDKSLEARAYNRTGVVYRGLNDYDKSMAYAEYAFKAAQESKDSVELGYAENNIGGTYALKSYFTLSLEHTLKALSIFESLNSKQGISYCAVIVGAIYQRQRNFDKALEYFYKAYMIRIETDDKQGAGNALNSVGKIYLEKKLYDTAYQKYKETEKIALELGDKTILASAYDGLSRVLMAKNDFVKALELQQKSFYLLEQIGNKARGINSRTVLGKIYANLGQYSKAENILDNAMELLKKTKFEALYLNCYEAYSNLYELKGDLKKSLNYSKMYSALKDSIIKKENIARGNELDAVNQYLKTKKENARLQLSIAFQRNQKTYLILIFVLLAVTFIAVLGRYKEKKADNNKLRDLNAMKDMLFRVIAHDLKNPFNTILGTTDMLLKELDNLSKDEIRTIVELIGNSGQQTYRLLENLLYWSMSQTNSLQYAPQSIPLKELVDETFELLMISAQSKKIILKVNSSGNPVALCDKDMIKTVLRNLISNGIKYSYEGGIVSIILKKEKETIEITVEDNGIGMTEERKNSLINSGENTSTPGTGGEKGTGLGLLLCKEFVEKNNGRFKIESEIGRGSRFIITLPALN